MGKLVANIGSSNVNVTLPSLPEHMNVLQGRELPCVLCGEGLPILFSKRSKPYCVCNSCGIQLFFRGKPGIERLRSMAIRGVLVPVREHSAAYAILLLNRLELLKLQRREITQKHGIILRNRNVENAIETIDVEIEKVQGELAKCPLQTNNKDTQ